MNSAGPRPQGSATGKQKQVPGILEAAEKRGCGLEETLEWIFRARLRGPRTQFSGRLSGRRLQPDSNQRLKVEMGGWKAAGFTWP